MKIRTQLAISIVLFIVALLIVAASVVMTNQQVEQLSRQQQLVKNIEIGAGELGYLSNDYLLYNESHQLDRWNAKFAEFSNDVSNLSVNAPEQQVLVDTIKASQQRFKEVFNDVTLTLNDGSLAGNTAADKEYIQVSWSRLAVQTRGIIFDASRLGQMLQDEENQVKHTSNLFIMALLGTFGAFILIDYLLVFGGAIKSIGNLRAGTKVIGSGNLDYTIKAKPGDEIGELATAFNQMTVRLKTITASKADLEHEMEEHKRTAAALRESEARRRVAEAIETERKRLFDVLETLPAYLILLTPDYHTSYANRYFEERFGKSHGRRCFEYLFNRAEPCENCETFKVLKTGAPHHWEWTGPDGRDYDIYDYPFKDTDGSPLIMEMGIDITDRKKAEKAIRTLNETLERRVEERTSELKAKTVELQDVNEEIEVKNEELAAQSEKLECANEELRAHNEELQSVSKSLRETQDYLENLINYANAPIIVWDPAFIITRFNKAFERLSGYTASEVIGKNLSLLFPPDSKDQSLDLIKKTLAGEQWESAEIPILHKYGSVRIALWNSANIYDDNHDLVATIAQGQDITMRKQAEKDLEDAKAQAELYLDLMGHDISNMHQIMMMQLELAADILKVEGKLHGNDTELIESTLRTLDKAARLINNVRKLQKHQAGEFGLEPIDLNAMLADVLKDYSNLPGKDVTIKFAPNGKSLVKANPLLKDVFSNIVDNAVKHSGNPLELAVNVSKVGQNGSTYYRVAIEDNGSGIPDDKKDEVFHRFRRGQTKAKGTGLGLYIVKTLVESFGGYVEIQNRALDDYTQGTRFLVYLPAEEGRDDRNI